MHEHVLNDVVLQGPFEEIQLADRGGNDAAQVCKLNLVCVVSAPERIKQFLRKRGQIGLVIGVVKHNVMWRHAVGNAVLFGKGDDKVFERSQRDGAGPFNDWHDQRGKEGIGRQTFQTEQDQVELILRDDIFRRSLHPWVTYIKPLYVYLHCFLKLFCSLKLWISL